MEHVFQPDAKYILAPLPACESPCSATRAGPMSAACAPIPDALLGYARRAQGHDVRVLTTTFPSEIEITSERIGTDLLVTRFPTALANHPPYIFTASPPHHNRLVLD